MAREFKVFISHSWTRSGHLNRLQNLLVTRGYFPVIFTESSIYNPINSMNEPYVRKRLAERIQESHIMLVIGAVYATRSEWMPWEMKAAQLYDVPIIGVIPWGNRYVSTVVQQHAVEIVRWNTESIVAAIRRYAN